MGAYPALAIQPPPQPDTLGNAAKMLQLKALMGQQQIQQQQLTADQLDNQQRQQALKDQQAMTSAMQGWDGKDVNALPPLVVKNGGSANAVMGLKQKILQQQDTYSQIAQRDAQTGETNLKAMKDKNDQVLGALNAVTSAPDEEFGQRLTDTAHDLAQKGLLDPQHAAAATQLASLDPTVARQKLSIIEKSMMSQSQQMELAKNQAETSKNSAEGAQGQLALIGQTLGNAQSQQDWDSRLNFLRSKGVPDDLLKQVPAQFSPQGAAAAKAMSMTPEQQARIPVENQAMNAWLAAHPGKTVSDFLVANKESGAAAEAIGRTRGELAAFGAGGFVGGSGAPTKGQPAAAAANNQTGGTDGRNEAALQNLNPAMAAQVKAISEGRMALPSGFALRSAYWQNMLGKVAEYDPTFDGVNYNARAQTRRDFTSGKSAAQINALNTVIGHLQSLSDAADNLNNRLSPTWNTFANALESATGDPRVKQFELTENAVSDELTRTWRQAGGSEADIQSWKKELNSSGSPAQLHGGIAKIGELLKSKLDSLSAQYGQGMGTAPIQVITPKAQGVLDKLSSKGAGAGAATTSSPQVTDPRGVTHTFPNQAAADAFKKAAGIQ